MCDFLLYWPLFSPHPHSEGDYIEAPSVSRVVWAPGARWVIGGLLTAACRSHCLALALMTSSRAAGSIVIQLPLQFTGLTSHHAGAWTQAAATS
ncbi:hypothetical protein DPEC_G00294570 [Dallia pectoralis]|uniref:Uncharacterized protein n=1 Tax=Dallia pectoralis TaxID=75939 RepID=A0ACC2FIJ2_DALPE|nr:hypothetical protein DPEC_G00294570 [Dallia pectoralis]